MNVTAVPVDVYVSVGSNICPADNLRLACAELADTYGELHLSPVYRSRSVGFEGDDFLNMVIGFSTLEKPQALLGSFQALHRAARRVWEADPYSPRTLDVDLLLYGNLVSKPLNVPHHDIDKYPFVAGPLAELAPLLKHPVSGRTMAELWQDFDRSDCAMQRVDLELDLELDPGLNPDQVQ